MDVIGFRFISFFSSLLSNNCTTNCSDWLSNWKSIENRAKRYQKLYDLKKKSSNLLRPGIPVLRSVRQFFLFFFQENCTQEKGRKEMTGGCTIDECAWVNEFLLFLSDGIYSFNVKTNSWWWDKLCAYLACSKNILLSGIPSKMQTANDPISLDVTFQELQLRCRQREFVSFPRAYLMF